MHEAKDQGHKGKCSPKKKEKRSLKFFFRRSPLKNVFQNFFSSDLQNSTIQKKCPRLPCPRAEDRAIFEDLKPRGQGLDLRGQGRPRGLHLWPTH